MRNHVSVNNPGAILGEEIGNRRFATADPAGKTNTQFSEIAKWFEACNLHISSSALSTGC